jgi:hypothetical protein
VADPLKTMVANTPLQPCCNHETRNYRNHAATTAKQGATTPQPFQFSTRNCRNRSLKTGRMVAGQPRCRLRALRALRLRAPLSLRSRP